MRAVIILTEKSLMDGPKLLQLTKTWGLYDDVLQIHVFAESADSLMFSSEKEVIVHKAPVFALTEYLDEYVIKALMWQNIALKNDIFLLSPLDETLAVRLGCVLGGAAMTRVEAVQLTENDSIMIKRAAFSQNLKAHYKLIRKPWIISIDRLTLSVVGMTDDMDKKANGVVRAEDVQLENIKEILPVSCHRLAKAETLDEAKRVIAIGRGVSGDLDMLYAFADMIDAKIGGTRAVVMDGKLSLDQIIGSSGKVLRADVCFALGVSGAMPFLYGIKHVKTVIAVNTDEKAPIFSASDWGFCMDWREFISRWRAA